MHSVCSNKSRISFLFRARPRPQPLAKPRPSRLDPEFVHNSIVLDNDNDNDSDDHGTDDTFGTLVDRCGLVYYSMSPCVSIQLATR